jgi:hypothetical protein
MKENKKFIIGLFFALVGVLLLLIQSRFWICGLLFTLIGLILILISNKKWLQKITWTIGVVVVTFIFLGFGMSLRGAKAFEEIYFSSKFSGKVRILYAKDCGISPEKKGDWTIINVDTNHVIIVKRENRRVFTQWKFFIVDENGNKTLVNGINKATDFKNEISVLDNYTGYYNDRDVNIQDFILMRIADDLPSESENKRIELFALDKLREYNCR